MKSVLLALLLSTPLAAQSDTHSLYVPFDDIHVDTSSGDPLLVNGNAVVSAPLTTISFTSDPVSGKPKGIGAHMSLQGAVTLEIAAGAGGSFSETLPLGAAQLPEITPVGGYLVTPYVVVLVTISGEAAPDMRLSFVQEYECLADVQVGPGYHTSISQEKLVQRGGGPEDVPGAAAHITVSTTLAVVMLSAWQSAPLGGPLAGVTLGANLDVNPTSNPWWSMSGEAQGFAGYYGLALPLNLNTAPPIPFADAGGPLILAPPGTRWSVALDAGDNEVARGVMPVPDGFALTGRYGFADEHQARLDGNGQVLSSIASSYQSSGFGQAVVKAEPTADGGQIVLGNGSGGARLDRLDAAGNVLWSRVFAHDLGIVPGAVDLVVLPDGGCGVLGGVVVPSVSSASQLYVLRVDPNGNVLWARDLATGSTSDGSAPADLAPTADGGWLVTGSLAFGENNSSGQTILFGSNMLLARLDANGNLLFGEVLGSIGNEAGNCVAEGADGTIWVGGSVTEGPNTWGWVSTFDASGALRWTVKLHGDEPGIFTNTVLAVVPGDGGAQLLGMRGIGPGRDAWLSAISDGGTPLMWKTLGGEDDDEALGLRVLPDGLLAWGYTRSPAALGLSFGQDEWVLRTSVDGMLLFNPITGFDARNDLVHWDKPANAFSTSALVVPSVAAATFTVTDKPLPFTPLALTEIGLCD